MPGMLTLPQLSSGWKKWVTFLWHGKVLPTSKKISRLIVNFLTILTGLGGGILTALSKPSKYFDG